MELQNRSEVDQLLIQAYRTEVSLVRIEAMKVPLEDEVDKALHWSLSVDMTNEQLVVITGHLFRVGSYGYAQALVLGVMRDEREIHERDDSQHYLDSAEHCGHLEAMYDVARRSISAQASLMDFDPELPTKAPEPTYRDRPEEEYE